MHSLLILAASLPVVASLCSRALVCFYQVVGVRGGVVGLTHCLNEYIQRSRQSKSSMHSVFFRLVQLKFMVAVFLKWQVPTEPWHESATWTWNWEDLKSHGGLDDCQDFDWVPLERSFFCHVEGIRKGASSNKLTITVADGSDSAINIDEWD